MGRRACQIALPATTIIASWLAMMCIHESGHVLNAWLTGGRVERVVLNPVAFSRTDLASNPHSLIVAWGGAAWGSVFPVLLWLGARAARFKLTFLLRFFAGFCLIANGAYLGSAAILPVGDAEDLIRMGAPRWLPAFVGLVGVGAGLALWNGIGRDVAAASDSDRRRALDFAATALVVLLLAMTAWTLLS